MAIVVKRENLQNDKYNYSWARVGGDGKYIGPIDRDRVSKREGYEVAEFIQNLMNKHGLKSTQDARNIENALHHPNLVGVVMRRDLISRVEQILGLH